MPKKFQSVNYKHLATLFATILKHRNDEADPGDDPHILIFSSRDRLILEPQGSVVLISDTTADEAGEARPRVVILEEGVDAYIQIIKTLGSAKDIGELLGGDFIQDKVNQYIQSLDPPYPVDEKAWEVSLKTFVKSLRANGSRLKLYLPVLNLSTPKPLAIGGVVFHPKGHEIEAVVKTMAETFEQTAHDLLATDLQALLRRSAGGILPGSHADPCRLRGTAGTL